MLSTSVVWRFTLLIALEFSFIFLGQSLSSRQTAIAKDNILYHTLEKIRPDNILLNNTLNDGRDVWELASVDCHNQIKILRSAWKNREIWAIDLLESSPVSKLVSTINDFDFDDLIYFDKCSSINVALDNTQIRGGYCNYLINFALTENIPLYENVQLCLPNSCSETDVENVIYKLYAPENFNNSLRVIYSDCNNIRYDSWTVGEIITITIFTIFISFLVISTICDISIRFICCGEKLNSRLKKLSKFSLYTNSLHVLSTQEPSGNLSVISGLRFISMCVIVLRNIFLTYPEIATARNSEDIQEWLLSGETTHYYALESTIDTFLVLSGCVTSYAFLNKMKKGHKFNALNLIRYYLQRYLRLTPVVGAMLLLAIFIFPHINFGIKWLYDVQEQRDHCLKAWWPMLLYVHNYVEYEHIGCLYHFWYLVTTMQLFIISPLILYPLAKKPTIGKIILSLLLVISIITPAIFSAEGKVSSSRVDAFDSGDIGTLIEFRVAAYNRAGPWFMGVFLGYILVSKKSQPRIVLKKLSWILAILSLGFIFISVKYYQHRAQQNDYDYNIYWEVLYAGFSHHIWGLGICCIIYFCFFDYGGVVNKFLSLPIFWPFAKISFSVYAMHTTMINIVFASYPSTHYFSHFDMINNYLSILIWSIIGGFIFYLLIEKPFHVLIEMLWNKNPNAPKAQDNVPEVSKSSVSAIELEEDRRSNENANIQQHNN